MYFPTQKIWLFSSRGPLKTEQFWDDGGQFPSPQSGAKCFGGSQAKVERTGRCSPKAPMNGTSVGTHTLS